MKIYYLVTSLEGGGAEFLIPVICEFFIQQGHDVEVLACLPKDMTTAELLEKRNIPYRILSQNGSNRFSSTYNLLKIIRKSPPDLIWTSLLRGAMDGQIAGTLANIPVVSMKHSAFVRPYKKRAVQWLQRLSQLWIADSLGVEQFLETGMKVSKDRIMTWSMFQIPDNVPTSSPWDGQGIFHIGSVGRLHPVKNYDVLIRAIDYINRKYPDIGKRVKLSIAGNGIEEQNLKELITNLNIPNVELLGFRKNVMAFLKTLHLYTQPSHYEGLCIATHEAMSVGLPIICSKVGELQYCVENQQAGVVLPNVTPEILGETFVDLFHHPEKAAQYGYNAKTYIQTHYTRQAFEAQGKAILDRIEKEIRPKFKKRHWFFR